LTSWVEPVQWAGAEEVEEGERLSISRFAFFLPSFFHQLPSRSAPPTPLRQTLDDYAFLHLFPRRPCSSRRRWSRQCRPDSYRQERCTPFLPLVMYRRAQLTGEGTSSAATRSGRCALFFPFSPSSFPFPALTILTIVRERTQALFTSSGTAPSHATGWEAKGGSSVSFTVGTLFLLFLVLVSA
jgi:hypothetical protein